MYTHKATLTDNMEVDVPLQHKTPETKLKMDMHLSLTLAEADQELAVSKAAATPYRGPRMTNEPPCVQHGRLGNPNWQSPRLVTHCDQEARPGYTSQKAHEFEEEPCVLREKITLLANLIRKSKNMTAYTGAGISTASGIGDYASKSKNSKAMQRPKAKSGLNAKPTLAHRVLVAIHRAGHLKEWVQQNHDGLPQKAGFPQERLNEIHGAWQDPSNPVVPMNGSLRDDLYAWLERQEEQSDLTVAMGTSLCGMAADCMVETPARKFCKGGGGLGSVIIGFQRTQYDAISSLRIYARIDIVAALLARELGLCALVKPLENYKPNIPAAAIVRPNVFKVPYDANGYRCNDESKWQLWDLSDGSYVQVTDGPGKGFVGTVYSVGRDQHFRCRLPAQREKSKMQGKVWREYCLGLWWIESAVYGRCSKLPVVNTKRTPQLRGKLRKKK